MEVGIQRNLILLLVGAAVISGLMFFVKIDSYPMQNWDEGVHSQVTREMLSTKDYWSLHYQGFDYFRKPPLKIWITAPMISVFGDHNWVYRFWSAIAGVATTVLLAYWVYKKEKKFGIAWLTTLIFVSGQYVFYHAFRTGEMDPLLVFFLTFGLFAYWNALEKPKWFVLMGISFGLCIMSKSMAGILGPIIVLLDVFLFKRWVLWKTRMWWYGISAFFIVAVPWHASQLIVHGSAFWKQYVGYHVVDRAFTTLYTNSLPWWWYASIIMSRLFAASAFVLGAVTLFVRDVLWRKKYDETLLVLWVLVTFGIFTFMKTKFEWYVLPLYPAAAWFLGKYLYRLITEIRDRWIASTAAISAFLLWAQFPKAVAPDAKTRWFLPQTYLPESVHSALSNRYVVAFVVTALITVLAVYLYRKFPKVLFAGCVAFVSYVLLFGFVRNVSMLYREETHSVYQDIAQSLKEQQATKVILFKTDLYDRPAAYFELAGAVTDIVQLSKTQGSVIESKSTPSTVVITSTPFTAEEHPTLHVLKNWQNYYLYSVYE